MAWIDEHQVWIVAACVAAAVGLAWWGLRQGSVRVLVAAVAPLLLGALAVVAGLLVVTPAEHAQQAVERLVAAVVAGDVDAAKECFSARASIHVGGQNTPGEGRSRIDRAFESFAGRHRIESNSLNAIDARSLSPSSAEVEISCSTRTASSYGSVATRWHFEVVQEPDGRWRVLRITWLRLAGGQPSLSLLSSGG